METTHDSLYPNDPSWLSAGSLVAGSYRVVRAVGEGAFGVVLLASDERLRRDVALKLVRPDLLVVDGTRERFLQEARAMARVEHPNVLRIYAFGEHEQAPYMVSAYVPGPTVAAWFAARSAGPEGRDEVVRVIEGACRGVAAIHDASTVHGDIKPSNMLVAPGSRVVITDFGLARPVRGAEGDDRLLAGTPAYMAPEVVLQKDVEPDLVPRRDVYALGCVAYELLTGRLPFEADGDLFMMSMHACAEPPRPSSICPDLPQSFDDVLLRALSKDPAKRPSANAFRRELVRAHEGRTEPSRILVAEDDTDFRDALGIALRHEFGEAEVVCLPDGAALLEAFDERAASLAIIDLQMPGMDGIELTRRLRTRANANAMPILVLTASGGPEQWRKLTSLGADGFLVKPVRFRDVMMLARRALEERTSLVPPPASTPMLAAKPIELEPRRVGER